MGPAPWLKTRKLHGFTYILLLFLVPLIKASSLGSCFRIRYKSSDGCGHLLRVGISQERCCTSHYRRAWSPDASPTHVQGYGPQGHPLRNTSSAAAHNQIWSESDLFGHSVQQGKRRHSDHECQPCRTSCEDVRCGEDRKCVLRNGIPKCVCNPKCHLQHKAAVCGTDGRTYSSECQLLKRSCRKKQRLLVAHSGPCQTCSGVRCRKQKICVLDELLTPRCQKCPKSCTNSRRKRAICGSDGVTYSSKCFLKVASCKAGITIKKAYKGPCQENANCDSVKCWRGETCLYELMTKQPRCQWCGDLRHCPSTATHICASDRNTYQSWCALKHASCRTAKALTAIPFHNCAKNSSRVRMTKNKKCFDRPRYDTQNKIVRKIMRQKKKWEKLDTLADENNSSPNTTTAVEVELNLDWNDVKASHSATEIQSDKKRKRNFKRRKSPKNDKRKKKRKKKGRNEC